MTVKRSAEQTFNVDLPVAVAGVRKVLDTDPIYKRISERPSASGLGTIFYTYVRPNIPLVLGTDTYVRLEPFQAGTLVSVNLESQPYIFGDAFGMYDRYIDTFMKRLNATLQSSQRLGAYENPVAWKTKRSYSAASIFIVVALVVFYFFLLTNASQYFFHGSGLFFWAPLLLLLAVLFRMLLDLWRK